MENPATWTKTTKLIDDALQQHKQSSGETIGLSIAALIEDRLRRGGHLRKSQEETKGTEQGPKIFYLLDQIPIFVETELFTAVYECVCIASQIIKGDDTNPDSIEFAVACCSKEDAQKAFDEKKFLGMPAEQRAKAALLLIRRKARTIATKKLLGKAQRMRYIIPIQQGAPKGWVKKAILTKIIEMANTPLTITVRHKQIESTPAYSELNGALSKLKDYPEYDALRSILDKYKAKPGRVELKTIKTLGELPLRAGIVAQIMLDLIAFKEEAAKEQVYEPEPKVIIPKDPPEIVTAEPVAEVQEEPPQTNTASN